MKIGIIGAGNLGSTFAKIFSEKHQIILYDINVQLITAIHARKENMRYLPGVRLGKNILSTTDLSLMKDCAVIIFAVPSAAVVAVARKLRLYYSHQYIISASKGLSVDGLVLTDVIEHELHCKPHKVIALSGPCIAYELARHKPTVVMLGGSIRTLHKMKHELETNNFFFNLTTDKQGIQLLGFYKNIIALLVGVCEGLGLGHNFESSLVSKAYSRFYYLNTGKNIHRHTFIGPAGLGDLYVTAVSPHSRNRTFGFLLGKGMSSEAAIKKIGQTVEGYDTLKLLSVLKKSHIDHQLTKTLMQIIDGRVTRVQIKGLLLDYLNS